MSRIAVIGDNSSEFINCVLDIWNEGNCAVLFDRQTPIDVAIRLMVEAGVEKSYVDSRLYRYQNFTSGETKIDVIRYDSGEMKFHDLPENVRDKFHENYSNEEAVVIYSSGTTGNSKGIILSHFALNTNARYIINAMRITSSDCIYIVKTLSHSATFTGELLIALHSGARLVLAPTILPQRVIIENIVSCRATILCLNPSLLALLAEELERRIYDLSMLKKIYVSGSILTPNVYRKAERVLKGIGVYNMYGLSEAGPRVTMGSDECPPCSTGRPIGNVEISVLDPKGCTVHPGTRGIVHVKTPCLFSGYISGKEKHESLRKGWFNTGDVGYIDEVGSLYILGRIDEVINLYAHKVYPSDVEAQIMDLGIISQCSVAAYKRADSMMLGCLYVSDKNIPDIKRRLKDKLLPYEIPHIFIRVESLPRTINGKVSRKLVAEQLALWHK